MAHCLCTIPVHMDACTAPAISLHFTTAADAPGCQKTGRERGASRVLAVQNSCLVRYQNNGVDSRADAGLFSLCKTEDGPSSEWFAAFLKESAGRN